MPSPDAKWRLFEYIVDNIMLTNYHTLAYVVETLASKLAGNAISEAFSQERDQLVLRFANNNSALVISCDRVINTLYLLPEFPRARSNSVDVLGGCLDRTISSVEMHPMDRVVMIRFESGLRLDLWFFGGKSNVVLVDGSGRVIDAFKEARDVAGTVPGYRTGEQVYDIEALRARLARPQLATFATVMKEEFPSLGSNLIKEILHRAGVPHNLGTMSVGEEQILAIQKSLGSVLAEISRPTPRVYLHDDEEKKGLPAEFSIVPMTHLREVTEKRFDDVHEAIRFFVARTKSREAVDHEKRSILGRLGQKLNKARRTIAAVEDDLKKNSRAAEYQRFGDLLMMHLHNIAGGEEKVVLRDDQGEAVILLQKNLTPVQNAQRYYEKVKRSRTAQEQAAQRLNELRAFIAPAETLLERIENTTTRDELKMVMTEHNDELEALGIGQRSRDREQLPFRVFVVDGGFEVWAGKSSRNNDELTMKYAKPNDLWFHARGAAGSHVVLKVNTGKGEPGKKAKEQAASIAAYYSKMKNAKMVPVAMTEKKYVRKQKGAAPGSVVVEREKVIFAEPALPRNTQE